MNTEDDKHLDKCIESLKAAKSAVQSAIDTLRIAEKSADKDVVSEAYKTAACRVHEAAARVDFATPEINEPTK